MSDIQMTHSTDCWQWHHECAKRVIAELRADIQRTENVSRSVRSERDYAVQQIGDLRAENERLARARAIVNEQSADDGLWFRAQTAAEAYLQQELRRLHAAVEGER